MSSTGPTFTLHWLENSRAQRIIWLMEELELKYTVITYARGADKRAPKSLRDVHPLGKSPVLVIEEDGTKVTIPESGAIVEFLCERYGNGQFAIAPSASLADYDARSHYLQWLHWAEGSATPPFIQLMVFTLIPKSAPFFIRPVASAICSNVISGFVMPTIKNNTKYLDAHLADKEFMVGGKLTGADIMLSFVAEAIETLPNEGAKAYPNVLAWHAKMKQRAAYQRAESVGKPNDFTYFLS